METGVWFLFVLITQGHMRLCSSQPDGGLNPIASSLTTDGKRKKKSGKGNTILRINTHQSPTYRMYWSTMVVTWSTINPE